MRPIEFEILLSLAAGDRHGYAIIQDLHTRSRGSIEIETGTLYRALQRLVDDGWVRPAEPPRAEAGGDVRRRYYALTPAGRAAAQGEARRLAALVESAKAARLLSRGS